MPTSPDNSRAMVVLEIVFWAAVGLLVYTHVGYPLLLWLLARLRRVPASREALAEAELPRVSLIVAAHDEEAVIPRWVRSTLDFDYPRDRLELVVVSDGSTDRTAEWATLAGADLVLELPRGGKVTALNAAVERASGEVLAFSDANAVWEPGALRLLVERLAEPGVGYVCGQVRFVADGGDNEEGLYWRYEMAVRELESRLAGVTAGNGAINAVRREAFIALEPTRGQDISLPFELVKRGWRPVYEPDARAAERMAATIPEEFKRKRRMMAGAWGSMLSSGLLSPRGYGPVYALEVYSHRFLRYVSPILHLVAFGTNLALLGEGWVYVATLAAQVVLLAAAALAPLWPVRPLRIARYYVAVTTSSAIGLWDYLRHGVPVTWEKAEGTR
jgi:cellulose synthase/poly-beta-1,6-N-acetylglucosamine synthase-like glycosyltransferase